MFNDTSVVPARLTGLRGAVAIEVTLNRFVPQDHPGAVWRAFARPGKRLKPGDEIRFSDDLAATVLKKLDGGELELRFAQDAPEVMVALGRLGSMPLPPYIRGGRADAEDKDDYQTMFARVEGAVAASTAALHFTPELIGRLAGAGIGSARLTLHVGAGTFLPVKAERTEDHVMHAEWGEITPETAARIETTRSRGGRVIAVGTTVLRVLETASTSGALRPFRGETDIFITPGYRFKAVDMLLTNFHLPRSTLFMLVSAFSGLDRMRAAYAHAMAAGYRFYSYGDACLLTRAS